MSGLKVLIADDEPLARSRLLRLLGKLEWVGQIIEASDVGETRRQIEEAWPDILLLDIQMPGGSGFDVMEGLGPFTIGWQWWAWITCFVLDDFNYYVAHRVGHRSRWFWASHVNHHSSQHYNLSTALRQTWTGFFTANFAFRIWPVLIGFHPAMIATCGAINLIYQFWIHTEAIGRMPRWVEAVMNTPSHHRVHHATNPLYLDRNYASVFIVWDRLLGTFQGELDGVRIRYGIVRQLGSFNLLWAVFHEWIGIARDVWRAPWRAKLHYMFAPPGWSHDGSRDTSDSIRHVAEHGQRLLGHLAVIEPGGVLLCHRLGAADRQHHRRRIINLLTDDLAGVLKRVEHGVLPDEIGGGGRRGGDAVLEIGLLDLPGDGRCSGCAGQGRVELKSQPPLDAGDLGRQSPVEAQIDIGTGIDADTAASAGQRTEARRIG